MLYDKKFYKYIGCCAVYFVFTICYLFFSNATTVWQASWFSDKFFVYQYAIVLLLGYSIISSYYNSQTYNRFETRKRIVTNQLLLLIRVGETKCFGVILLLAVGYTFLKLSYSPLDSSAFLYRFALGGIIYSLLCFLEITALKKIYMEDWTDYENRCY